MDETISSAQYLPNIYEKLATMTTDMSLLRQDQEHIKEDHKELAQDVGDIKKTLKEYDKRFDAMATIAKYKGSWLKAFERNWLKILLVITPICIVLFEGAVWLKNLPVPPL